MQKLINIITHPLTIIISFLMIIIVGQDLGGFYIFYIILAIPHFGIHAMLAILGILILLINYYSLRKYAGYLIHQLLNIVGVLLLALSLYTFFYQDPDHYNEATLHQVIPLIIIGIYFVFSTSFLIQNLLSVFKNRRNSVGKG